MMTMPFRKKQGIRSLWIGVAGIVAAWVPAEALACSFSFCDSTRPALISIAPAEGLTIPANAPALVAETSWWAVPEGLELGIEDGGVPRTTVVEPETSGFGDVKPVLLLKLHETLVPGTTYRLRAENRCTQFGDAGAGGQQTVNFIAGPPRPLPTTIGHAQVSHERGKLGGRYGFSPEGSVTTIHGDSKVAIARIVVTPSAELEPYLPVTRFSTYVDGVLWGESQYGRLPSPSVDASGEVTFRDFSSVFATCDDSSAGGAACEPTGVAPGRHAVELRAHIAGADTDPAPLRFPVDLSCSCKCEAGVPPDPPVVLPDRDGGAGGSGSIDSPGDDRASADEDKGGCTIALAGTNASNTAIALALLASAVTLMRRAGRT